MKFMNYFQFALCLIAFIGVVALVIKNIVTGAIDIWGIPFAASFLLLMGIMVLCSWAELKQSEDNENKIK